MSGRKEGEREEGKEGRGGKGRELSVQSLRNRMISVSYVYNYVYLCMLPLLC